MRKLSTYALPVAALTAFLRPPAALGQEAGGAADTMEWIAAAFFADLEAERWESAAGFLDSTALVEWYAGVLEEMDLPARFIPTVDRLMAADPEMSREVAEHAVAEMRVGRERYVRQKFAHVESLEALRDLEPQVAAARTLEARGHRYTGEMFPPPPADRELDPPLRSAERRQDVLGSVRAGEDLGHVVYLERWVDPLAPDAMMDVPKARVVTLRSTGSGWALLPEGVLSRSGQHAMQMAGPPMTEDCDGEEEPSSPVATAELPEERVRRLFSAMEGHRWEDAASHFDPEDLDRWHRETVQRVEMLAKRPTVDEMLARQPDLPRAVAEHRVQSRPADPIVFLDPPLARVVSLDEVRALSSQEAAARALEAGEGAGRVESMIEQHGERVPPQYMDILREMSEHDWSREVIGVVRDPDGLAHVVYRARWGGDAPYAIDEVRVLSLTPTEEGWRARRAGRGLLTEEPLPPDWPATLMEPPG